MAAWHRRWVQALRRLVAERNLALSRQLARHGDLDSLEARDRYRAGFEEAPQVPAGRHLPRARVAEVHPDPSADGSGLGLLGRPRVHQLPRHLGAAEAA